MKPQKIIDLNVDSIGNQEPLSTEDKKALNNFSQHLKAQKETKHKLIVRRHRTRKLA